MCFSVGVSIMYRKILKSVTISFIFWCSLGFCLAGTAAEKKESTQSSSDKNESWTKKVDNNLQFGAESEKKSVNKALSAVKAVSKNIQDLKLDVITLNKDLRLMEEQLLFPSSTKMSFFLSLDTGQFFTLESVKLKLDGKLVATHLYSEKQRSALARGGIQKLYITNLSEGKHTATAFFTGLGPNGRPYKRAKNMEFKKKAGSGYIEIAITDNGSLQEPVFNLKRW